MIIKIYDENGYPCNIDFKDAINAVCLKCKGTYRDCLNCPLMATYKHIKKQEKIPEVAIPISTTVTNERLKNTEKVLRDNGLDNDDAQATLQAIGYVLLDTELYPD